MMDCLFINDYRLQVRGKQGEVDSNGTALIQSDAVYFDVNHSVAPLSLSRIKPEQVNNRYWQNCDESAIADNQAGMRSAADLIWNHLRALKNELALEEIVLVVPSHYSEQQLQLLIGIAEACDLIVLAVINRAVLAAASSNLSGASDLVHLDLQTHQLVMSRMRIANGMVELLETERLTGLSVQSIQEDILHLLQQRFIKQDRFDPLHHADTEQQLFDQLYGATQDLVNQGSAVFNVNFQQKLFSQTLDKSAWLEAIKTQVPELSTLDVDRVLFEHHEAVSEPLVLELAQRLVGSPIEVVDAAKGVNLVDALVGDLDGELYHLTELPITAKREVGDDQDEVKAPVKHDIRSATHLLSGGVAVPIQSANVTFTAGQLEVSEGASNLRGLLDKHQLTSVSGEVLALPLAIGERLISDLGDGVVTAIAVMD
ncbi:MAG: hypothetical protein AAF197_02425 [Pseudomonadota bacterium]